MSGHWCCCIQPQYRRSFLFTPQNSSLRLGTGSLHLQNSEHRNTRNYCSAPCASSCNSAFKVQQPNVNPCVSSDNRVCLLTMKIPSFWPNPTGVSGIRLADKIKFKVPDSFKMHYISTDAVEIEFGSPPLFFLIAITNFLLICYTGYMLLITLP